jgi:hypothetical protein
MKAPQTHGVMGRSFEQPFPRPFKTIKSSDPNARPRVLRDD